MKLYHEYEPKGILCDDCEELHCRGREVIHIKRAFPIPHHIETCDLERFLRILQQRAEDTGHCNQYCDVPMTSPDFHKHRSSLSCNY